MAKKIEHPPGAAALSSSMRDIGYSLDTAIADIIDNSISANAENVWVHFRETNGEQVLGIIDDGYGMNAAQLKSAMRYGSDLQNGKRKPNDMGKFGLGLKTASLSQCRCLTVVSRQAEETVAATWDLDEVDQEDRWVLNIHEKSEIESIPLIAELPSKGTLVLWRKLDRLVGSGNAISEVAGIELHLSLVFHRFLIGEAGETPLTIKINGHSVEPFDPFCKNRQATREFPPEKIIIGDSKAVITPYILPHYTKLSKSDYTHYNEISNFYDNQGLYVYRNKRLMAWGSWFSVASRSEVTKLARIQVDFTSDQDAYWVIDIKKSKAKLHSDVKNAIRRILPNVLEASKMHFKPQVLIPVSQYKEENPVWQMIRDAEGVRFDLNREHPVLHRLLKALPPADSRLLKLFLDEIADNLPVELIYTEFSASPDAEKQHNVNDNDLLEQLRQLYWICVRENCEWTEFATMVKTLPDFARRPDLLDKLVEEVKNV